ncbi:MAG: hypothetical protein IJZ20_02740 [Clostridia bacterium]|nr:hypothetical protein [Clostridia bacterium]
MKLHEELYFDITAEGTKADVKKFAAFLTSGELDDFFEMTSDLILYSDNYAMASDGEKVSMTVSNDDYGIEIDSFNPEEFLDVLCAAGKNLFIHGNIFDIDDEEYRFSSQLGDSYYVNSDSIEYSDELDLEALKEERDEDDYDEE